ncbi:MAG: hypothetical protein Q3M24_00820 [Candidatus Electrothrix aestuarii]|uniref:Uncharacterized protein n=1 Tax=Candidatus Electrothrix aestuarii TaxID=3062594 RepID=A0AAU8LWR1_9BACT|nr:hypothetical protein [Candidatus Electrothrix aestuarii]
MKNEKLSKGKKIVVRASLVLMFILMAAAPVLAGYNWTGFRP